MIKHVSSFTEEKILETIQDYANDTNQIIVISGFITLAGFKRIISETNHKKIKRIIVGVFTEKAKEAFQYIEKEYPKIELYIYKYLGHEDHPTKSFFTPILHAKIIAGFSFKKIRWAYTGSANITDYALNDDNIESGIFIKEKNEELEKVNETINKINKKDRLIDYKQNRDIFFTPDEKFVHHIERVATFSIPNTSLIIVNDYLGERNHQFIGIYCNKNRDLLDLRNDEKILFYFIGDMKLILNRVRIVGDKVYFPQNDISFYLENINNQKFKIKEDYDDSGKPDVFIIVENITLDENTDKLIEKINKLINQKSDNLLTEHIALHRNKFFDRIIYKETKSTLKSTSLDYLKNNKIIDITKLEIEKGKITTLKNLYDIGDPIVFNHHFSLYRIKNE
jgi:hypothetical protein